MICLTTAQSQLIELKSDAPHYGLANLVNSYKLNLDNGNIITNFMRAVRAFFDKLWLVRGSLKEVDSLTKTLLGMAKYPGNGGGGSRSLNSGHNSLYESF